MLLNSLSQNLLSVVRCWRFWDNVNSLVPEASERSQMLLEVLGQCKIACPRTISAQSDVGGSGTSYFTLSQNHRTTLRCWRFWDNVNLLVPEASERSLMLEVLGQCKIACPRTIGAQSNVGGFKWLTIYLWDKLFFKLAKPSDYAPMMEVLEVLHQLFVRNQRFQCEIRSYPLTNHQVYHRTTLG